MSDVPVLGRCAAGYYPQWSSRGLRRVDCRNKARYERVVTRRTSDGESHEQTVYVCGKHRTGGWF